MNSTEMSDYLSKNLETIGALLIENFSAHNEAVGRKVKMLVEQFFRSSSIEEFKQVGIGMRDAWIEFSRSIYRSDFVSEGEDEPGPSDVKGMIRHVLSNTKGNHEHLLRVCETAYSLCNKLQHDDNATAHMSLQCVILSATSMALIIDAMVRSELYASRPYYKCPNCGSLRLEIRQEWVQDIDGAFKVDKLVCTECNWFYVEEMGGMSGVGA